MPIPPWIDRLRLAALWAHDWTKRHKTLSIGGVVLVVVYGVLEALWTGAMLNGIAWLFTDGLRWLWNRPTGVSGLVFLGALFLLCCVAVWQTRPARHVEPPVKSKETTLSAEERDAIQHARVEWTAGAAQACDDLVLLLRRASEELGAAGNPLAPLLGEPTQKLHDWTKQFQEATSAEKPRLAEVQTALVALREAYLHGLFFLQRFLYADPTFPAEKHFHGVLDRWRESHPSFAQVYSRLSKHADYETVLKPLEADPSAISFVNNHGFRETVRSSRARVIAYRLDLITDDEQQFLNLFMDDAPLAMQPEQRDTWLPNAVHRAADALVRDNILDRRTVRPGVERFCLTEPAQRVLSHKDDGFKRTCVEVDLHAVFGTGASGSGAPGSSR
jgi:hypothetical protein